MNNQTQTLNKHLFRRLFRYAKPYFGRYALAIFIMAVLVAGDLVIPYFLGLSLKILGEEVVEFNRILVLIFLGVADLALICGLSYAQTMILHHIGHKIIFDMRNEVLEHIQSLSHAQFNDIPTGKLVTRVTSDINVLFTLYTNILVSLLRNIITIISVFITMALLNIQLTLLLLIIVPFLGIGSYVFRKYSRKMHRAVRDNISSMNAFLSENISGIKITQVFNQEDKKYDEFKQNNAQLKSSLLKEILVFGIFRPSIYLLYLASVVIVFWFGGNWAIEYNLGVGSIVLTYDLLYIFYNYISKLFNSIQTLDD